MKVKTLMQHRKVEHCEHTGCTSKDGLTVDHKIPKIFLQCIGIEHVADNIHNLQVLCSSHNGLKGSSLDLTDQWTWDTVQRLLAHARDHSTPNLFK